ncbi:hypothetical protein YB2330_002106 [Saitoella coloradoensis]
MTIRTAIKVDLNKPAFEQPHIHNRWHPEIPFAAKVAPGEVVNVECVDWTGGQIGNNNSADDIRDVDLNRVHYLSGPLEIEGAKPGDALLVEILEIQPFKEQNWGFTGVFHSKNGGGFLADKMPKAAKAIWDFEGIYAKSRHIPGVRFPGIIHPGLMGCAPSKELLAKWTERESGLCHSHGSMDVAKLPTADGAHPGAPALEGDDELAKRIRKEGARTVPPREHGGNVDIKNLSRGSRTWLPVYLDGAKFSIGDLHFSQGDGEISFCGAIEMSGIITLKFGIIPGGVEALSLRQPMYLPGPVQPQFSPGRMLTFQGISVDADTGEQKFLDVHLAYKQTCLNAVKYLQRYGYSDYQIYLLLSAAPVEGHIAAIVDIPNACTTLGLPLDMFEFDVAPVGANMNDSLSGEVKVTKMITQDCPISDF